MPFDGMSFGAEPPGRVGARIGDGADHDGDDEARPKVTFSDTPHLRCRSRSASLPGPDDPHAAGPPISRAAAEEAGRLFLQDRHSRMSRGSARASKIPFAVPQSLRNRRPTLMGAVLDDSKDSVKLREGLTGLVFALVYASNYTDAQSRLNEIRNSLAIEAGGVHTAMLLVRTLDDTDP